MDAGPSIERYGEQELERALSESENRFRCLIEYSRDAYLLYDERGGVHDVNPSACEAFGYPREELTSLSVVDLVDGGYGRLTDPDGGLCGHDVRTIAVTGRRKDGATFPAELTLGPIETQGRNLFVALARDVSDRERAERQIEYLGGHDALTGLPNCRAFTGHVEAAVERAQREGRQVAVLHVDLNRFSLVNQGLGPDGGDQLLAQTASRLREAARPMDVVARYSADEFLLLLADIAPDDGTAGVVRGVVGAASAAAEKVHRALERPFTIEGTEIYVDASIGISAFPLDADGASVLLRNADAASQQAKRPGEGPTKLFAGETSDKWGRLWLATRLRKAIERRDLVLHYQPIVDLGSFAEDDHDGGSLRAHVAAVEALVRWRDGDGLVPPLTFIPLAEDLGLISAIGDWVTGEVCRQALDWREQGMPLDIAMNLSLHELWQPDLPARISRHVESAGLAPSSVTVEITESAAMTDPVRTRRVLTELKERGFRLAIDDFGAGHSSLGRLSELPCQMLKIDRSFVARLPDDPSAVAMVTAMIELARGLEMVAVAEGIETPDQLEFLVGRGCPMGQGFLFSRPLPASQIPAL